MYSANLKKKVKKREASFMNSGYSQNIQKQKTKTKNPFPPTTNNCRVPLTSALLDGIFM